MSGAPLYALAATYQAAYDAAIDVETGEVTDDATLVAQLDAISDSLAIKVDAVCRMRAMAKGRAVAAKNEIQRLQRIAASAESTAERIEAYVERCLRTSGQPELRGALFSARIQKNPPKVVIDDESAIPAEYTVVERTVRRDQIKKALQSGEDVPGAHLEQTESLRIR